MVSRRSGRYLETFLEPVAPLWPSMGPWRATATPFSPKIKDFLRLQTRDICIVRRSHLRNLLWGHNKSVGSQQKDVCGYNKSLGDAKNMYCGHTSTNFEDRLPCRGSFFHPKIDFFYKSRPEASTLPCRGSFCHPKRCCFYERRSEASKLSCRGSFCHPECASL